MSEQETPSARHRTQIYQIFTDTDRSMAARIEQALEVGRNRLNLGLGFVTEIEDDLQRITHVVGTGDTIRPGVSCPLSEAYCKQTVQMDGLLSAHDAATSELIDDLALQRFELGSYIGCKVTVDGELRGTVCFADELARPEPFSEAEELFVELLARQLGHALERQAHRAELERRNRQMRIEKERYQSITENSFDVIFRLDDGGRFTYLSASAESVLSVDPAEVEGAHFTEYVTDASRSMAEDAFEQVQNGQAVQHVQIEFVGDGEPKVLEVNVVPLDSENTALQGAARDVTVRHNQEREIHVKTRAMERADVGIAIAEAESKLPIVYVNQAFATLTGYSPTAAVGQPAPELLGPRTEAVVADRVYSALETREPVSEELLTYRADGRPFWSHLAISPVTDDAGQVSHLVGILDDVTDRKRTARLVQILNRTLRHNLRNDMNVLLIDGDRMQRADDDAVAGIADRVQRTAAGLVDLSDRARDLEQYANQPRSPGRVDPAQLLGPILRYHREEYPGAAVAVDVETDRNFCVGSEMEAAVVELLENALDHHPGDPVVRIAVEDAGEDLQLTVVDDGPGIADAEADVIAAGEETDLEHGSGLGLWLVNWIVTRYGGSFQIRAGEALGLEGTVATILMPAVEDHGDPEEACRPPTPLFT
ncbi:PAS domain S-box protein [Halobacteriales archaeon Cl-PHB]